MTKIILTKERLRGVLNDVRTKETLIARQAILLAIDAPDGFTIEVTAK